MAILQTQEFEYKFLKGKWFLSLISNSTPFNFVLMKFFIKHINIMIDILSALKDTQHFHE